MKKFLKTLIPLFLLAFIFSGCDLQNYTELKEYFDNLHTEQGFNGTVLVAKKGEILFSGGYGLRDVELNKKNNQSTIFNIASLSKQFTSMAIMMLAEDDKLSVNDTVDIYIPEIIRGDKITIKQCLNHTSGLTEYLNNSELWSHTTEQHSPSDLLQYFAEEDLVTEPGTSWSYCNTNYVVLGIIVERVSGKDLNTFLKQNIFNRLGMFRTFYDAEDDDIYHNRSSGYDSIDPVVEAMYFHPSIAYAAGALNSTIVDLYKWTMALNCEFLVSRESLDEIFTPGLGNYGYGWWIDKLEIDGEKYDQTWHWGSFFGYGSYITRVIDEDITVIILQNVTALSPSDFQPIAEDVIEMVLD